MTNRCTRTQFVGLNMQGAAQRCRELQWLDKAFIAETIVDKVVIARVRDHVSVSQHFIESKTHSSPGRLLLGSQWSLASLSSFSVLSCRGLLVGRGDGSASWSRCMLSYISDIWSPWSWVLSPDWSRHK